MIFHRFHRHWAHALLENDPLGSLDLETPIYTAHIVLYFCAAVGRAILN